MKVFGGSEAFLGVLDPVFLVFSVFTRSAMLGKPGEHLTEILELWSGDVSRSQLPVLESAFT